MDGDGSLAGRILSQKRVESGRKRLIRPAGEREYPEYAEKPAVHGLKRQRNRETEMREAATLPLTDGDRLFAQKCRELQGFIRPLAELLNGLKKGRYEQGLSSFQRSVAMDRIQRIVGVLQKPEMGERYLGTLLQVEMMLKVWFPHQVSRIAVAPKALASQCTLSLSEDSAQNPAVEKLHLTDPAAANGKADMVWREQACFLADWSAMNLTWMHTSPICNPPLELANLGHLNAAFSQALLGPNACGVILFLHNNLMAPAPFFRSTSVTPDKSSPAFCHPKQPPGTGDPPRCQSLPGAMAARSYVLSQHPDAHLLANQWS
uniref:Circadian associated repressor of transcription n=1 Tax=Chelonoidis abingdonii TaxID=106734 RepID=A0A8C0GXB3_CHEAB